MKLDSKRVREGRERLALSIDDASEKAGVSPHTWIRAERGEEIRPSSVRSIAKALGAGPAELMEEPVLAEKDEAPPLPGPPVTVKNTAASARFKLTVEAKPEKWLTDILYDFADHVRQGTEDDDVLVRKAAHRILERVA